MTKVTAIRQYYTGKFHYYYLFFFYNDSVKITEVVET